MPHVFETQAIETERFYTGVISNRNPLAIPIKLMGRRIIELYDAILLGFNAEISVRSTLQRAAGYIPYNTNTIAGIAQKFYAFQPTTSSLIGNIYPIVDTTTDVLYMPPGAVVPTSLMAKTLGKQSSFFGVGPYLYIGNAEFLKKWDVVPQGVTDWGITISSTAGNPANYAGTGATFGGTPTPWLTPGNAVGPPDAAYATQAYTPSTTLNPDALRVTNYGFAVPAASTVSGIEVDITGHASIAGQKMIAQIIVSGNGLTGGKYFNFTTTDTTVVLGQNSDLWGSTHINVSDVNDVTFGVQISPVPDAFNTNVTNSIDAVRIKIFFNNAPAIALVAGTLSATQGYQYLYVYGNSHDGNISNPTAASVTTGPFAANGVQITLIASTDPQVDQIRVFRTTDTGTGAVFFEIPTSPYPNANAAVVDNAPDNTLIVTNAITVGTLAFTPPPTGLVNIEWYAGRLWGSVGNLLYFAAGPDNFPMGNGNSDWPPGNVFALPTQIVKLSALNGGNGMLVTTIDGIHVVQGLTNPGFTVNKFLSDVGARQQNAVDTDGSTIYMFTSDRQFVSISATGIQELSQPISDQTDFLDPTLVYVCQHRSGSQDSRVFLTDGTLSYYPYNLMFGCWEPKRTPNFGGSFGSGAMGSIEISPGVFKLLLGSKTAGNLIMQRDLATFSDNGGTYPWSATFGSIPLANPSQLANVESSILRYRNSGSSPILGILPNDTNTTFITVPAGPFEPPEGVAGPVGFTATKYYLDQATNLWTQMAHLQLQITFIAEAFQDELLSWGIFPNQSTDQGSTNLPAVQGR